MGSLELPGITPVALIPWQLPPGKKEGGGAAPAPEVPDGEGCYVVACARGSREGAAQRSAVLGKAACCFG